MVLESGRHPGEVRKTDIFHFLISLDIELNSISTYVTHQLQGDKSYLHVHIIYVISRNSNILF